jgi:hypothetical protein
MIFQVKVQFQAQAILPDVGMQPPPCLAKPSKSGTISQIGFCFDYRFNIASPNLIFDIKNSRNIDRYEVACDDDFP